MQLIDRPTELPLKLGTNSAISSAHRDFFGRLARKGSEDTPLDQPAATRRLDILSVYGKVDIIHLG